MDVQDRFRDLMGRARRGEDGAVDRLIEEFGPQIRREVEFLMRRNPLRQVTGLSDVYQSVMGRFFLLLSREGLDLERPEDLKNLLKAMVKNRIADLGRFHGADRRDYRKTVRPDPDAPIDPASPQRTPSSIASRAELEEEYRRLHGDVLGRLSAETRAVLELREEGLGWPEVAERIGHGGPEAVRKRCERDLARARAEIEARSPREKLEELGLAPAEAD